MALLFEKAAVLGATGPAGRHVTQVLADLGTPVRLVARNAAALADLAAGTGVETRPADLTDEAAADAALDGADIAYCCVGAPVAAFDRLVAVAETLAAILQRRRDLRLVLVSSTWSFLPIQRLPLDEAHPRRGGPRPAVLRRQMEDVLRQEGAAVLNLPDFYGPLVGASTLQRALTQAVQRRRIACIGAPTTARDYVYLPDAMRVAVRLAAHEAAYGRHWILAGPGPISMRRVAAIAAHHLGRSVWPQGAGRLMLSGAALFDRHLRAFLPLVPAYMAPVSYDDSALHGLIGDIPKTSYGEGIARTLDWLAGQV
ncbi:MAG: NAD(P)H-binding protein [Alphaproteobacteria bacterium]|jgi:nucleoside-diphosphate-sugar epimerase|nr:NAD(P)H-binding protein [Alphaproteobacteria bacterium]